MQWYCPPKILNLLLLWFLRKDYIKCCEICSWSAAKVGLSPAGPCDSARPAQPSCGSPLWAPPRGWGRLCDLVSPLDMAESPPSQACASLYSLLTSFPKYLQNYSKHLHSKKGRSDHHSPHTWPHLPGISHDQIPAKSHQIITKTLSSEAT